MRIGILAVGAAGLLSCGLCLSARAEGPITTISGKMTTVAGDLAKTVTGEPVQNRQKEIVKDRRPDCVAGEAMPAVQERHGEEQSDSSGA
jgi:hypothetical protein